MRMHEDGQDADTDILSALDKFWGFPKKMLHLLMFCIVQLTYLTSSRAFIPSLCVRRK